MDRERNGEGDWSRECPDTETSTADTYPERVEGRGRNQKAGDGLSLESQERKRTRHCRSVWGKEKREGKEERERNTGGERASSHRVYIYRHRVRERMREGERRERWIECGITRRMSLQLQI